MHPRRIEPLPGQESVWDYPRPARVEDTPRHIEIVFNDRIIVDTRRAKRVLETSHPPVYYVPPEEILEGALVATTRHSVCEWKGAATYYSVIAGDAIAEDAAWSYLAPTLSFAPIRGYVAFYPSRMDACLIDGVPVHAQPGDFYGGWITPDLVGPFKGDPGTRGW